MDVKTELAEVQDELLIGNYVSVEKTANGLYSYMKDNGEVPESHALLVLPTMVGKDSALCRIVGGINCLLLERGGFK